MKKMGDWAFGPDVRVVGAELVDGGWLVSAIGEGDQRCPDCGEHLKSLHSWHNRRLQDLPVQGERVALQLQLGRWRCRNRRCERKTFVERLPALAAPVARRTHRVIELLQLLGHTAGGRPGEMLAARLAIPASDNTILRQLKRRAATRAKAPVRVAGIDDWSWRKGWKYGTIIVDLERREVVDVIAERSMEAAADWFARHPEVEVVCRDRCGLYAQGAREGAPQARQVADRFHLLQNLRETIEHQMTRISRFAGRSLLSPTDSCGASGLEDDLQPSRRTQRDARHALFDRVHALYAAGKTPRDISVATGVGRPTVRQWIRSGRLADRAAVTPTVRSPRYFKDYLSRRWDAGCTNGGQLLHEIKRLGYTGCYSHLQRFLAGWRRANCETPTRLEPPAEESRAIDPATGWQISPIASASLCMTPRDMLTSAQAAKVEALKQASPSFIAMRQLAIRFRGILRGGGINQLDKWLDDAHRCGLSAMQRFARAVNHDLEAVRHAATERWSNGLVEGQINRLKTLKRAMYGRAGVELLRARLVPFL
jgi:transposase